MQRLRSLNLEEVQMLQAAKCAMLGMAPRLSALGEKFGALHRLAVQLPGVGLGPSLPEKEPVAQNHVHNVLLLLTLERGREETRAIHGAALSLLSESLDAPGKPPARGELETGDRVNSAGMRQLVSDLMNMRKLLTGQEGDIARKLDGKLSECAAYIQNVVRPEMTRHDFDDKLFDALSIYRERDERQGVASGR